MEGKTKVKLLFEIPLSDFLPAVNINTEGYIDGYATTKIIQTSYPTMGVFFNTEQILIMAMCVFNKRIYLVYPSNLEVLE